MIQIMMAQGDVLVEDKKKAYTQMARPGMMLDEGGNYLIATTATSRAQIMVNGQLIKLEPSSFLRLRGDQSWWDRHTEHWRGDAKLFLGRLWARVAKIAPDDAKGGGGIRG
jgi:hypothetical protein